MKSNKFIYYCIFISILIHLIVLSIKFVAPIYDGKLNPQLTAIMVNAKTTKVPAKSKFMATMNQDGGGNVDEDVVASTPFEMKFNADLRLSKDVGPENALLKRKNDNLEKNILKVAKANKISRSLSMPKFGSSTPNPGSEADQLAAQIEKDLLAYASRPKKMFIGAQAEENYLAKWVYLWQQKVEKIGNNFYPDGAKGKVRGNLILTVGIKSNGNIDSIAIEKSSGYEILDNAAKKILALGVPFPAFSEELKNKADIIYVTRKWSFGPQGLEALQALDRRIIN